uniref:BPTI/Kunitz inhibitor domain-containing protein n=1 Tax=Parastrongyloides trichosuri TaxID=131310 RepID=A0A0N4Z0H1_PARTI
MEPLKGIEPYSYNNTLKYINCSFSFDCPSKSYCYKDGMNQYGSCCQNKENICMLLSSPGYGDCENETYQNKIMYYFDSIDLMCKPFRIGGCKGLNNNRFHSIEECKKFCHSSACLPGELPIYTDHLGTLKICTMSSSCPSSHTCRFDTIFRRHVCCGRNDFLNNCPSPNLQPYLNSIEESAMTCQQYESFDTCPNNFVCLKNVVNSTSSFCCGNNVFSLCPNGNKAALTHKNDSHQSVMKCNLFKDNQCPRGFECLSLTNKENAIFGVCCEKKMNNKFDHKKYSIEIKGKICTPEYNECDEGFYCHSSGNEKGNCRIIKDSLTKIDESNYINFISKTTINKIMFMYKWLSSKVKDNSTQLQTSIFHHWIKTEDSLCPYVYYKSSCTPKDPKTSIDDCKHLENETNIKAFCQFNIQYQKFACCSFKVPSFS